VDPSGVISSLFPRHLRKEPWREEKRPLQTHRQPLERPRTIGNLIVIGAPLDDWPHKMSVHGRHLQDLEVPRYLGRFLGVLREKWSESLSLRKGKCRNLQVSDVYIIKSCIQGYADNDPRRWSLWILELMDHLGMMTMMRSDDDETSLQ
jgi:hypothetical protein